MLVGLAVVPHAKRVPRRTHSFRHLISACGSALVVHSASRVETAAAVDLVLEGNMSASDYRRLMSRCCAHPFNVVALGSAPVGPLVSSPDVHACAVGVLRRRRLQRHARPTSLCAVRRRRQQTPAPVPLLRSLCAYCLRVPGARLSGAMTKYMYVT